jgi:hypothetical protein
LKIVCPAEKVAGEQQPALYVASKMLQDLVDHSHPDSALFVDSDSDSIVVSSKVIAGRAVHLKSILYMSKLDPWNLIAGEGTRVCGV